MLPLLLLLSCLLGLLLLLELFAHPGLNIAHLLAYLFSRLVNGNYEIKYQPYKPAITEKW